LYREDVTPANPGTGHPYNFKVLPGVKAIIPKLSDRVDDSFNALRTRLQAELGYDALGNLADATRPASYYSGTSEYLSWHKAGRAFDASFDYATLVREDSGGQTYWRVYLHCASQDGTQGEPLHDFSTSMPHVSSTGETLREGGQLRPLPRGYFVDFTVLAQEYGWDRIAAHAGPNFDWHKSWKAVEYWHFQKTAGLVWYQAMQEVYAPEVMQLYDWYRLLTVNEPVPQMIMHGTPVPLSVRKDFKPHLP
jgi:TolB protein